MSFISLLAVGFRRSAIWLSALGCRRSAIDFPRELKNVIFVRN
jgi:hypothetical protein